MPLPATCPALYRPRQARSSPLYGLLESHYEEVKGQWDERFASRCGSWRGACVDAAYAFLDCQPAEAGIDPLKKLVDRNADDNRRKVKIVA